MANRRGSVSRGEKLGENSPCPSASSGIRVASLSQNLRPPSLPVSNVCLRITTKGQSMDSQAGNDILNRVGLMLLAAESCPFHYVDNKRRGYLFMFVFQILFSAMKILSSK